jgi:hypothetical protein
MKLRGWLRGFKRARDPEEDALWPRAMSGGRSFSTALTLLIFIVALTVNDLRLFRFPAAFIGSGLAAFVFATTPPFFASRLLSRALTDAPDHAASWLDSAVLRRRALLGFSVFVLILWLIFFASGRPPRW